MPEVPASPDVPASGEQRLDAAHGALLVALNDDQARRVMITAHNKGTCVVAVFTREMAEAKAARAVDMARKEGFPPLFTTEPEQ